MHRRPFPNRFLSGPGSYFGEPLELPVQFFCGPRPGTTSQGSAGQHFTCKAAYLLVKVGQSASKQRIVARVCAANIYSHVDMAYLMVNERSNYTCRPIANAAGKMRTSGTAKLDLQLPYPTPA